MNGGFKKLRWWVGINGALSIAFGAWLLFWPDISLFALTILFGGFAAATGVVGLVSVISGTVDGERGWLAVMSILNLAVGIAVLVWPSISARALLYVIGFWAIVLGINTVGGAFWLPLKAGDSAGLGLIGLVSILFGLVMFAKPGDGALVLLALIAAYALVSGASQVIFAIDGTRIVGRGSEEGGHAPLGTG
jgi:uncharacterized membrane protein HdeD (DUF308 family)